MDTETTQKIAGYIALAVPATVAITALSKIILEWLNQQHSVKTARVQQAHEITTHYLNVPLAIRHQLLRFLATPDKYGTRLNDWAKAELQRVQIVVDETDRAVSEAEKALMEAKTGGEVQAAEKKLAFATSKKQSLLEKPKPPPVTPATLRAGLITDNEMQGFIMKDSDLKGMELPYRKLNAANFSGSNIAGGSFQGSDLRGANFEKADLTNVSFYESDCRSASFRGAKLESAHFHKARLESTDLTEAILKNSDLKRAIFDDNTKWPDGFEPEKHGAVKI